MARKRLTQLFPFLLPIRVWQRNLFYYIGMKYDSNKYSKNFGEPLKYKVCTTKTLMINENSGQDSTSINNNWCNKLGTSRNI